MKKYLILGFVLVVIFISGCQNKNIVTGGVTYVPVGEEYKVHVEVYTPEGKPPMKIKGYCGDQLTDHGEKCDFYGDGTPMFPGGDDCTTIKYQGRTFTGGVLMCYAPGSATECKLDVSGCY